MSGANARFEYLKSSSSTTYSTARNNREFTCDLNIDQVPPVVRGSGIVCTIGPACQSVELLKELISNGMNIARLNFSHGSHEYHGQTIKNVRIAAQDSFPHPVAIALDTKGPEIRTGNMKNGETASYKSGQLLKVSCDPAFQQVCDENLQFLEYPSLSKSVHPGSQIFIADGSLSLTVKEIVDNKTIMTTVNNDAVIGSRKNCNLPGAVIDLPAVSEKDKSDLMFGLEQNVDMVFASFIRKKQDVLDVKAVLGEAGKNIKIISKIENHEGIININEILEVTDGVMVARGDMGMEIPLEKVFVAQKMLIARCNKAGKPVICATQMLESMIKNPRPTRAEITDVGNAVVDGADCVMLSGETASGLYPIQACAIMHKICRESSACMFHRLRYEELKNMRTITDPTETTCIAALSASFKVNAAAIIVLTTSGNTGYILSSYHPRCPIIAVTRDSQVARQCHLYRGIFPLEYTQARNDSWFEDIEARLEFGIANGRDMGFIKKGSFIVFVTGWQPGASKTNTIRILQVQDDTIVGTQGTDIAFN